MKSWIRKIVLEDENDVVKQTDTKPSLAEEAAAAAKAAAAAAADVAKASQEMLNSKNNGGSLIQLKFIYSANSSLDLSFAFAAFNCFLMSINLCILQLISYFREEIF